MERLPLFPTDDEVFVVAVSDSDWDRIFEDKYARLVIDDKTRDSKVTYVFSQ